VSRVAQDIAYEFGPFRVDVRERRVWREEQPLALTPKVFDLLLTLLENPDRALSKPELMRELWPDTAVEESNLTVSISSLRKVLSESRRAPRYIETLPRRGYRFIAEVRVRDAGPSRALPPSARVSAPCDPPSLDPQLHSRAAVELARDDFVGRESELKRLSGLLERARSGAGSLVLISGEPGIGKSALAAHFLERARGSAVTVATGRCLEQYGAGAQFLPFFEALAALLAGPLSERVGALLRAKAPTWCLELPALHSSAVALQALYRDTLGATRERMLRELGDALDALAAGRPLLLLLEDLHWADPSSIDALRLLAQRMTRMRLLVLGTLRPADAELGNHALRRLRHELAPPECEQLPLGSLDAAAVARLVAQRFAPRAVPPDLPGWIAAKSDGHPLFASELCDLLIARAAREVVSAAFCTSRPLRELAREAPDGVRGVLQKKLDLLTLREREILHYASVEGEEFGSLVLAALLDQDELKLEECLARLEAPHGLVRRLGEEELKDGRITTRYRFAHALYRDILYAELVGKRRAALHRAVGAALLEQYPQDTPGLVAQLAVHFEHGRDFVRAVEQLKRAGDSASRVFAYAESKRHYDRALELLFKLPPEAASLARADLHAARGWSALYLREFEAATQDFQRAELEARARAAPELECDALIALAYVCFYSHRFEAMLAHVAGALRCAEAAGSITRRLVAVELGAARCLALGELDGVASSLDEAIAAARDLDAAPALAAGLFLRGLLHFFQSEYRAAERLLSEAIALESQGTQQARFRYTTRALYFLGLTLADQGQLAEALARFDELSQLTWRNGERDYALKIPNARAWIYRELGLLELALAEDGRGVQLTREHQHMEARLQAVVSLGLDHVELGDHERARVVLREAALLAEGHQFFRWRALLRLEVGEAEAGLSRGDLDAAAQAGARLLAAARRCQARKYIAIAHHLLARTALAQGDTKRAEAELGSAQHVLQQYPVPIVAWKLLMTLGRVHEARGAAGAARQAFLRAEQSVQDLTAALGDGELREQFLASPAVRHLTARCAAPSEPG